MIENYRKHLSGSSVLNAELILPVGGELLIFYKNGPGLNFLILMHDERVLNRFGRQFASMLKEAGNIDPGNQVIGRYQDNASKLWWPIIEDDHLDAYVGDAVKILEYYIKSVDRWKSFKDFLAVTTAYDYYNSDKSNILQFPLDYHWLVGDFRQGKGLCDINLGGYEGVLVRSNDSCLPIYSSHLRAAVAAEEIGKELGIDLQAQEMPCVGCYLHGAATEVGRDKIKMAILENQWAIHFKTCAEVNCSEHHDDVVRHFKIVDNGQEYYLKGCRNTGQFPKWYLHEK